MARAQKSRRVRLDLKQNLKNRAVCVDATANKRRVILAKHEFMRP
jgi:hypothetical protein